MQANTVWMKVLIFYINVCVISICLVGSYAKPAHSTKSTNDFGTYLKNGQIISGYIGCLFSRSLCEERTEWCYNDGVFGRCLSITGTLDSESLYRYDLSKSDAHAVEREMERLFAMGYRWGHLYTQCELQTLLESIRRGFNWDQSVCAEVQDQDLEGALKAFEEDIDPKNLAYIKYHPSSKNPHSDFADENYRPPKELAHLKNAPVIEGKEKLFESEEHEKTKATDQLKQQTIDLPAGPGNVDQKLMEEELANAVQKTKAKNGNKGKNKANKNKNKANNKGEQRNPIVKKSVLNIEYPYDLISPGQSSSSTSDNSDNRDGQWKSSIDNVNAGPIISPAEEEALMTGLLREWNSLPMDDDVELPSMLKPKIFSSFYNTPDLFRHGVETRDDAPPSPLLRNGNGIESSTSGSSNERSLVDVNTELSEQRARQAELNRREDEQEIREAAAQLEAALIADSLLRNDMEHGINTLNGRFSQVEEEDGNEPLEFILPGHYKLPVVTAQDPISHSASIQSLPSSLGLGDTLAVHENSIYNRPLSSSNRIYDEYLQNDEPELDDDGALFNNNGELVFLDKGRLDQANSLSRYEDWLSGNGDAEPVPSDLGFYNPPLTKEDEESLMYLKRFIDNPVAPNQQENEIRQERERSTGDFDTSNYLLYGNPESVDDVTGNGYEELTSFLGDGYGGGNMGFERQERLDVKKPGPWYRTVNNYAFDKEDKAPAVDLGIVRDDQNPEFGAGEGPADMVQYDSEDEGAVSGKETDSKSTSGQNEEIPLSKLESIDMNKKSLPVVFDRKWANHAANIDVIDTSYVNLELDTNVNFNGAEELINLLSDLLEIDRSSFGDVLTTKNTIVSFKVGQNDKGLNATAVAQRIGTLTEKVEKELGVKILKIDVGLKTDTKTPSVVSMYVDQDPISNKMFVATFAVCGLVAAVLVAAVALFLVRKHAKSKEKLVRLSQDDPTYEACKDYQDLCRARMAGSKNSEKMEPLRGPSHKVASKDSENGSSSSRSEEPVLTNMDISTGHMVLSYMEDHLKNRDRMDREWAALTAYEADPCSTAVAEKPENAKKNRYSNSLPFDHSRVILNDLANISGTDYINASTITDHDPRNPAYIATQGPLPNTVADFWQLVWEQGSVVIVNLSRLAENGTALCHRYWPEEGSELHHIYEVHLVSEHIWCDEYLVRSFYLKNLKTGETRTVTQFHFLAWPENGIPQSTKALLEFRRKVNKSYRGRSCPIIVHCSDGAGRTGTYCLIDMVLNRMSKGAKEIDIAATLEHIRDQRPNMVRSKQQFEFVLMAVAEEVHAILKALPQ